MITVRVWRWDLDDLARSASEGVLSEAEQARAARFVVPFAASRFIAARLAMRRTLAAVMGADAAGLKLAATPAGKPYLPGGPQFNLSHSGPVALFAVASIPVGIDVEAMRPIEPGVARLVFGPQEQRYLAALPPAEREAAFYRGWTRKEATIKAQGGTLADLQRLTVLPHPSVAPFSVHDLAPPPGYAAALAAPGHDWTISRECRPAWETP